MTWHARNPSAYAARMPLYMAVFQNDALRALMIMFPLRR